MRGLSIKGEGHLSDSVLCITSEIIKKKNYLSARSFLLNSHDTLNAVTKPQPIQSVIFE